MTDKLYPFLLVATVLGMVSQLAHLNLSDPWVCGGMLAVGLVGMYLRSQQILEPAADPAASGGDSAAANALDYARLQTLNLKGYVAWIEANLRGHNAVVEAVVQRVQQNLGLAKADQTLGAFILVGPPGTGKKFLAQLLNEALYPKSQVVLLNMSEYRSADDLHTLLGAAPGMMGAESGGTLTRPVLMNPYRVIVLDQLERAHRDVHRALYDILDAGSCHERSSGKLVSFGGCVFFGICGSGVPVLRSLRATASTAWDTQSREALSREADLESAFLGRWDGIYLMDELPAVNVAEVACLKLAKHWKDYGIEVVYASPALLLNAVKENAEFKGYGVRQLGAFIEFKTNGAIAEARRLNRKRVALDINDAGEIVVKPLDGP